MFALFYEEHGYGISENSVLLVAKEIQMLF